MQLVTPWLARFREYHALLEYELQRRDALDEQIEQLALLPALAPMVERCS